MFSPHTGGVGEGSKFWARRVLAILDLIHDQRLANLMRVNKELGGLRMIKGLVGSVRFANFGWIDRVGWVDTVGRVTRIE
jgi:hypothetical protein